MTTTTTEKPGSDVLVAMRDPAVALARRRALTRKRWIKRGVGVIVVLAIVAALIMAARPRPVAVELATVRRGVMSVSIEEAGRTRVRDRYVVVAPLVGELARITLRAGDKIQRGGELARIVPQTPALLDPRTRAEATARLGTAQAAARQAQANVTRVELALEHARGDAERMRRLAASGSVNADDSAHAEFEANLRARELASARFGAETAAHEVEVARAVIARYGEASPDREAFVVASPIAGRVLRVIQASAGMVTASAPLIEIGDPAELEVVVDVLTEDAVRIPANAKVVLERWGGPWPLSAHVRVVEPSAFTRLSALGVEEQRVSVIIDFDEPVTRRAELGDGYRVEARIVTWEHGDVIALPASAAFRRGEGWAVFVVADGRAKVQSVEIGRRSTSELEIVAGVRAGDTVVIHPSDNVRDGVRVATR